MGRNAERPLPWLNYGSLTATVVCQGCRTVVRVPVAPTTRVVTEAGVGYLHADLTGFVAHDCDAARNELSDELAALNARPAA